MLLPAPVWSVPLLRRVFAHRIHRGFGGGCGAVSGFLDRRGFGSAGRGFSRLDGGFGVGDGFFLDAGHGFIGRNFDGLGFGFGRGIVRAAASGKGEAGGCNGSDTELHVVLLG